MSNAKDPSPLYNPDRAEHAGHKFSQEAAAGTHAKGNGSAPPMLITKRSVSSPDLLSLAASSLGVPPSDGQGLECGSDGNRAVSERRPSLDELSWAAFRGQSGGELSKGSSVTGPGSVISERGLLQPVRRSVEAAGGCTTSVGWQDEHLVALAKRMQKEVEVRDRHWHLKKYSTCFVGRDAVKWLMCTASLAATEEEAVGLGNAMMQLGLLAHVNLEHPFKNRTLYYRFHGLEGNNEGGPHGQGVGVSGMSGAATGNNWVMAREVTRLQRQVAELTRGLELQKAAEGMLHESATVTEGRQRALERRLIQVEASQQSLLTQPSSDRQHTGAALSAPQALVVAVSVLSIIGVAAIMGGYLLVVLTVVAAAPLALLWIVPRRLIPQVQPQQPQQMESTPWGRGEQEHSQRWPELTPSQDDVMDGSSEDLHDYSTDEIDDSSVTLDDKPTLPSDESTSPPDIAQFAGWPDRPALLRLKPGVGQHVMPPADPIRVPLNGTSPIDFESEHFSGKVAMWAKGLGSTPAQLFKGKRRRSRITVQGRFKHPMSFDDVLTGQEFSRVKNLPAKWLVESVLLKMARAISPSVEIGALSAPSILIPVVAMAHGIVASRPGEEPDMMTEDSEDMHLCGDQLRNDDGSPITAAQRKRLFYGAPNRQKFSFDPEMVYTFHIFQHLVNLSTYELDLSVYCFDLTHYLDGQPLQFMMRPRNSRNPIFSFELWHEKLLSVSSAGSV